MRLSRLPITAGARLPRSIFVLAALALAALLLILASGASVQAGSNQSTPVDVVGLSSGVAAVSAGISDHTCAVTTGDGVKCWGYNFYGQLGDGTTTNWGFPVDVVGLSSGVAAVSLGHHHTCALTTGGGVKCWGRNTQSQLGDGTTTDRLTPVDVVGLSTGVAAVSTGQGHACALTTGGGLKCWGRNWAGQLGDGTTTDRSTPADVVGLSSGVAAVSAGGGHTCALTTEGGIKCWGRNDVGQLGDGTTIERWTPVDVVALSSGVAAVATGQSHACALTTAGGVKCWGSNDDGQLGDGTTTDRLTPVDVVGLSSGVAAVSTGASHTCGLTTGGGVKCWGRNGSGQLGDGTTTERWTPVDVVGLSSGVAAVATGWNHSCALTTGAAVKCWGNNFYGQLGNDLVAGSPPHEDSTYDPVTEVKFCNAMDATFVDPAIAGNPACSDDLSTGTAADFWTKLDMSSSTDLHFSDVTTFAPSGSTINAGTSITTGAKIGGYRYQVTVGLSNAICNSNLNIETVLYNVALPDLPNFPRGSGNIGWPRPDGAADRFGGWTGGANGDHTANAGAGNYATAGAGTVVAAPPRADGSSVAIQNYPVWLLDMFDPDFTPGNFDPGVGPVTGSDGPLDPILPLAVYGGVTQVAGSWTPVYIVQFAPGALAALSGAQALMNADIGWPNVAVTDDPTSVKASPSTITDFCTPLDVETVLLGTAIGGGTRATNPATAGTHYVTQRSTSLRDLDQDGFENAIDTCPRVVSNDPRAPSGTDTEPDGIDNIAGCDTTIVASDDEDGDGVLNRGDNCPLVANPLNEDSEVSSAQADLGPSADAIGDACDSGVVTVASQNAHGPFTVTLSTTVANGRYHIQHNVIAKCFGGLTDADGDGYCAGDGDTDDTPDAMGLARHKDWGSTHPGAQMDTDGDGWSDALETYFGTDPVFACSADTTKSNEPISHWPLDGNDDGKVNVFDVVPFISALNHYVGEEPFATSNLDFRNDGFINVFDIVPYISTLGHRCADAVGPGSMGFTPWSQQ